MSDMYKGISGDDVPTVTVRVPGTASGGSTPGAPAGKAPGGKPPGSTAWSRGRRAAVLAAVCAVAGGGAFAIADAAAGSPAAAPAAAQAGLQAASTASAAGQAAVLRDVLTSTGPRRLARLRHLGGLHGEFTYQAKAGPATLAFERGTITSASGGAVVIRAADGTTWTWSLTGTSVIREQGTKEAQSALAAGQAVFAAGPVTGGTRDARIIVIRKAGAAQQAPSGS